MLGMHSKIDKHDKRPRFGALAIGESIVSDPPTMKYRHSIRTIFQDYLRAGAGLAVSGVPILLLPSMKPISLALIVIFLLFVVYTISLLGCTKVLRRGLMGRYVDSEPPLAAPRVNKSDF